MARARAVEVDTGRTIALSVAGTLVLLATVADALLTTVRAGRAAGPMTERLADLLWRLALRLRSRHGPPAGTGPAITFAAVTVWVVLLVGGWFLIFSASPGAVVDSKGTPADSWARLYFTASRFRRSETATIGPRAPYFKCLPVSRR